MRIAVFGGSFDPVHTEHIRLTQAAIEELGLDKLIVSDRDNLEGYAIKKGWTV